MQKKLPLIIAILISIAFWCLRLNYWNNTSEPLFSDMSDYDGIAHNIIQRFAFGMNDFWKSYVTPALPIIRAIQIMLFGEDIFYWQLLQSGILFLSLLWLMKELRLIGVSVPTVLVFFLVVTLSKSSIFWSLKLARESLGEAFIYLCTAASISCFRKKNVVSFFIAGLCYGVSLMNRSNSALMIPFFILNICVVYFIYRNKESTSSNISFIKALSVFTVGLMLIWGPWIIRSYNVYGHFFPLASQAPFIFFWDRGEVTLTLENGEKKTFTTQKLQIEAQDTFENDYQGAQYAKKMVNLWFKEHWREYPQIVASRIYKTVINTEVSLTKVSRFDLFSGIINKLLLDKTPILIVLGLCGLLLGIYAYGLIIAPLFYCATLTWIGGAIFLDYPRMLEPSIPVFLFGNYLLIAGLIKIACKLYERLKTS